MFTVLVNVIDYCIMLYSTVVCTELCTLLLIIVTNKNAYSFMYVLKKSLLRIIINKRTGQTCKDNYIILLTSFQGWLTA